MQTLLEAILSNTIAAAVLGLVVYALTKRVRHPAFAYWLWLVVLLKLVTPPLVCIPFISLDGVHTVAGAARTQRPAEIHGGSNGAAAQAMQPEPGEIAPTVEQTRVRGRRSPARLAASPARTLARNGSAAGTAVTASLAPLAVNLAIAVWAAGVVAWFTGIALQTFRFQRLLRYMRNAPDRLQEQADIVAATLGLTCRPRIKILDAQIAPLLWPLGREPCVVLPGWLLEELNESQQTAIIAHELAHLRRHDYWIRWLEIAVVGLYWWNPVAWWTRRELHNWRELYCDTYVMEMFPARKKDYANALLKAAWFLSTARTVLPQAAAGLGSVSSFKRRIEMLARNKRCTRLPWPMRVSLVLIAAAVLPVSLSAIRARAEVADNSTRSNGSEQAREPTFPVRVPTDAAEPSGQQKALSVDGESAAVEEINRTRATLPPGKRIDKATLRPKQWTVDVDPNKHCVYVMNKHPDGDGALRVELARGVTYAVSASGAAYQTSQTGSGADPFPGVLLCYGVDDEDGYAIRQTVLKPGDSLTFRTPWRINPDDEVFLLAFFLDLWADSPNRGSYSLTITQQSEPALTVGGALFPLAVDFMYFDGKGVRSNDGKGVLRDVWSFDLPPGN